MLIIKIKYKCKLCNKEQFYTMPMDEKTPSGDTVSSLNKFLVTCKACRQKYSLVVNIREL